MTSKTRILVLTLLVLGLSVLNLQLASAHNWWKWHWHPGSGNTVKVAIWNYTSQATAAVHDWDYHTDLNLPIVGYHTNVSVFGGNYGDTGWWGLAEIKKSKFDWGHKCWGWCRIKHAHARYNSYYGGSSADIRGIFCQEVGHTFGLDHSNTGDCMGKTYYNNINVTGPHNWADINAKY
ncbi:MAG: hypothetical protein ACE5LU_10380 [Anaerolineae bacterium]